MHSLPKATTVLLCCMVLGCTSTKIERRAEAWSKLSPQMRFVLVLSTRREYSDVMPAKVDWYPWPWSANNDKGIIMPHNCAVSSDAFCHKMVPVKGKSVRPSK